MKKQTLGHGAKTGSQNRPSEEKRQRGICFVISPFGGWNDQYYQNVYAPAIRAAGLAPSRADEIYTPTAIVNDIWDLVTKARVLLADLTGKNPNVFYELGLAHAAAKPVILLSERMDDVPFDLRALRVILFDRSHPRWGDLLAQNISRSIKEVLASPEGSQIQSFLRNGHGSEHLQFTASSSPKAGRSMPASANPDDITADLRNSSPVRGPREAEQLVARALASGIPNKVVFDNLSARGVPGAYIQKLVERISNDSVPARNSTSGIISLAPQPLDGGGRRSSPSSARARR